jgi:hypothetical protein
MDAKLPTNTAELHAMLRTAIVNRLLVMFEYNDLIRVVEPHRFGVNSAGNSMLSGWLRAGYSRSDPSGGWRNYLLDDIRSLQVLDAPFAGARPGYAAHDHRMVETWAELTTAPNEVASDGPFVVREPMPRSDVAPPAVADQASRALTADPSMSHDGEVDPPGAAPESVPGS